MRTEHTGKRGRSWRKKGPNILRNALEQLKKYKEDDDDDENPDS